MPDVILINIHGGFPSSMVSRSIIELGGFRRLSQLADVHDRVYPTNACAGPAMHDMVMDTPIGSMTDSIWHEWSAARRASRTLFHMFQQHGMRTRLFGAFGLDARLDPHSHMHVDPSNLGDALNIYGIDECDAQDAAFTCQLGIAHDADILKRVVAHLNDKDVHGRSEAIMVNLLGCQDAHKCTFHDIDPQKASIPIMQMKSRGNAINYDERMFSSNVISDNPRDHGTQAYEREALRRAAQLKDWIRGEAGGGEREDIVRAVTGLRDFCWKCIQQIDRGIEEILNALEASSRLDEAIIYVYSDHPIGMYEHGELCEAHWESCLRSFMLRKPSRSVAKNTASVSSVPLSMASLPAMILADASISSGCWHIQPSATDATTCVTLGLAVSWLARASMAPAISVFSLRTFFVRVLVVYNDRPYAVTIWFSLNDLARASNLPIANLSDDSQRSRLFARTDRFVNPILGKSLVDISDDDIGSVCVYEHTSDPDEMDNIMQHRDWRKSTAARCIKERIDAVMLEHNLQNFILRIPENIHAITPERVTFCSVQLHHRVRDRLRPLQPNDAPLTRRLKDASTQTDTPPTFDESLVRAFGNEIGSLVLTQLRSMTEEHNHITIFAPDDVIGIRTWPSWVPPPVKGAIERDTLIQYARERRFLIDAVQGASHALVGCDDDHIFFDECRVSTRTPVVFSYSKNGRAIVYRAFRTRREARAAAPQQYKLNDEVHALSLGNMHPTGGANGRRGEHIVRTADGKRRYLQITSQLKLCCCFRKQVAEQLGCIGARCVWSQHRVGRHTAHRRQQQRTPCTARACESDGTVPSTASIVTDATNEPIRRSFFLGRKRKRAVENMSDDDWADWDDDADSPVEVPIIGTPLDSIEKSIGIPHKYRIILNWIVFALLIYLIVTFFTRKKKMKRSYYANNFGDSPSSPLFPPAFVPPPVDNAQRMKYDENNKRWLVDVGDFCNPSLCVSDKMVNELCSYTCGTLGFGNQSAPARSYSDPLSPLSMMPY